MPVYINKEVKVALEVKKAFGEIDDNIITDKEFWGFVKGLPSMIVQEGILQTLVFLKAKKETKYHKIFDVFNKYAKDLLKNQDTEFNLIKYLINNSIALEKYLYLEEQMLQYAVWFKRIGLALFAPDNCK